MYIIQSKLYHLVNPASNGRKELLPYSVVAGATIQRWEHRVSVAASKFSNFLFIAFPVFEWGGVSRGGMW